MRRTPQRPLGAVQESPGINLDAPCRQTGRSFVAAVVYLPQRSSIRAAPQDDDKVGRGRNLDVRRKYDQRGHDAGSHRRGRCQARLVTGYGHGAGTVASGTNRRNSTDSLDDSINHWPHPSHKSLKPHYPPMVKTYGRKFT